MNTRELFVSTAKAALATAVVVGGLLLSAVPGFVSPAEAQAPPQGPPNILVIMGDDVGWFNIGAYHRGIMAGRTQTSIGLPQKACCSRIITPRPVAPPDVRPLSPANCRSAPA